MMRTRGIFRDIGLQAAGNYISTALRVVRGFLIAGLLGPTEMGLVATGNLFLNYAQYADVGMTQGVGREVPMALGRGEAQEADDWAWYAVIGKACSGIALFGGAVAWLLSPLGALLESDARIVLVLAAVANIGAGQVLALQTVARGRGDFVASSTTAVVLAVSNLAFGLVGAFIAGAIGVTSGVAVASSVSAVYAYRRVQFRGTPRLTRARFVHLARIGVPLALLTFIGFNLENIDQVMILALLDRTQLGLYAIVIQAGGLLTLTGLSVSNVVGPRLLRRFASLGTTDSIRDHTWKPAVALSAAMPAIIILAWLAGAVMIETLLPKYGPSVAPLKIYLVAMYFLSLNLGVSTTLLALGKHRLNVPIMIGCIAFNVVADIVIVGRLGLGIEGVALASLLTYTVYWLLHTGLVRWYFEGSIARSLLQNLRLAWPGLVLVFFLWVEYVTGSLGGSAPAIEGLFLLVTLGVAWIQLMPLRSDIDRYFGRAHEG